MLQISLFGGIRMACLGGRGPPCREALAGRTTQRLLAYLLIGYSRSHARALLTGNLWPERSEHRANRCLSTALWQLRRQLAAVSSSCARYVRANRTEVTFSDSGACELDVRRFELEITQAVRVAPSSMSASDAARLADAIGLRTAPLLVGWYDEWVLMERERLDRLYCRGLRHLMRYHEQLGAFEACIADADRLLAFDPLQEDVHRQLMHLFLATGQRWRAAVQYERCRDTLERELGIVPSFQTYVAFRGVCASVLSASVAGQTTSATLRDVLRSIDHEIQRLLEARRQLQAIVSHPIEPTIGAVRRRTTLQRSDQLHLWYRTIGDENGQTSTT